jgi:hypothetical protein
MRISESTNAICSHMTFWEPLSHTNPAAGGQVRAAISRCGAGWRCSCSSCRRLVAKASHHRHGDHCRRARSPGLLEARRSHRLIIHFWSACTTPSRTPIAGYVAVLSSQTTGFSQLLIAYMIFRRARCGWGYTRTPYGVDRRKRTVAPRWSLYRQSSATLRGTRMRAMATISAYYTSRRTPGAPIWRRCGLMMARCGR